MAPATIRRHIVALVEAGMIFRRDSANGKRFCRRDDRGVMEEAFGFDLAPLALCRAPHSSEPRGPACGFAATVSLRRRRPERLVAALTVLVRRPKRTLAAEKKLSSSSKATKVTSAEKKSLTSLRAKATKARTAALKKRKATSATVTTKAATSLNAEIQLY